MDIKESNEFINIIHADVTRCVANLNEDNDFDFWARAYIRGVASLIEGVTFIYKKMIVSLWVEGTIDLNIEQQLFFRNLDWRTTRSGKIEINEKKLSAKDSLKTFFVQLREVVPNYSPDFDAEWAKLLMFFDVRDALIHPKSLVGLKLEKSTLLNIECGRRWFHEQIKRVNDGLLTILPARG